MEGALALRDPAPVPAAEVVAALDRGPQPLRWRTLFLVSLLGVVLLLPSLRGGFLLDDWVHQLALAGDPRMPLAGDQLYGFLRGDPLATAASVQRGELHWWTAPDLKLWFWRPLSSALLRLDHALAGGSPLWYHAHSLLWLWGSLLAAGAILRRVLPRRTAFLACCAFAVAPCHAVTAGWVANRNALVALLPALLALLAHLRWRLDGWRAGAGLAPVLLAVALLGSEAALGVVPFFVMFEALARREPAAARVRALLPVAAVVALYLGCYWRLGCGARGSGFYLDPVTDPSGFVLGVLQRVPVLLGGALALVPPDLWFVAPATRPLLIGIGVAVTAGALLAAGRTRPRPAGSWLWVAALLALVPVAATVPSFRLLPFAGLGTAALAATLAGSALAADVPRLWRAGGLALFLLHLLGAPALSLAFQAGLVKQAADAWSVALAAEIDAEAWPRQHVVLVNGPDFLTAGYTALLLRSGGGPAPGCWPASWRALTMTPHDLRVTRTDDRTLEVEVLGGALLDSAFEQVFRDPRTRPLRTGDTIDAGVLQVQVLAAEAGGATRVAFRATTPLEAATWCWLCWQERGLRRLRLPAVGAAVVLPWSPGPGTPGF